MIAVSLVVVRTQDHVEKPAGAVPDSAQERALGGRAVPIREDADPRTVGQREARDVDSV